MCLVFLATASLYLLMRSKLEKSTDLFLADKLHVVRTLLRERPEDWDGLREEIELESAARRYEQFYIRLLDERRHTAVDDARDGRAAGLGATRQRNSEPS